MKYCGLHYENKVGLVPLSKTIHQIIHSSEKNQTHKLFVPLYMVYGNYQEWLEEYSCADGIDFLYEKLERKLLQTKEVTPETFDAITKNFTYIHVKGFDEIQKMDVETSQAIKRREGNFLLFFFVGTGIGIVRRLTYFFQFNFLL